MRFAEHSEFLSIVVRPLIGLLCLCVAAPLAGQTQDYRSVVPASARTDAGLFAVHRVGEALLFEIPDSLLGRDMALMSRYAGVQADLASGGDRMAPND